jgi:hypothetical protein
MSNRVAGFVVGAAVFMVIEFQIARAQQPASARVLVFVNTKT